MEYTSGIYLLYGLSFGKWKAEMGGAVVMSGEELKTEEKGGVA